MYIPLYIVLILSIVPCLTRTNENVENLENVSELDNYTNSILTMHKLLQLESKFISNLKKYYILMQQRISTMRLVLNELNAAHEKFDKDNELYMSNPLNGYSLIRRLHMDLAYWQNFLKEPVGQEQFDFINKQNHLLPTKDDLDAATSAILKLQVIYDLRPSEMAKGFLHDEQFDTKLSALDCHYIGKYLMDKDDHKSAIDWLKTACEEESSLYKQFFELLEFNRSTIWLNLAACYEMEYDLPNAKHAIQKSIELNRESYNLQAISDLESYDVFLKHDENCLNNGKYEPKSGLHCYYQFEKHPFLQLAPFKVEQIVSDPVVLLYYDVVYNNEIKKLIEFSKPRLQRILLNDGLTPEERISQHALITTNTTSIITALQQRVIDITGYDSQANWLGLYFINYGIGGHYLTHFDSVESKLPNILNAKAQQKTSTILFYLNEIEDGGSTVFPHLQLSLNPKKGNALFWHHQDNQNYTTIKVAHAACPVLVGSKWIAVQLLYANTEYQSK